MSRTIAMLSIVVAAAVLWPVGCQRNHELRPPEIVLGAQECEHCRMIISDERYATGLVVDRGDNRSTSLAFDDVNCLFDYESEHPTERVLARFVHDAGTRTWLTATDATYLLSDKLQTPMGSSVAAASTREALATLVTDNSGTILDFTALQAHFARRQPNVEGSAP